MKIWIDVKNLHEPLFFKSIISMIPEEDIFITCRDFSGISELLKRYRIEHQIVGSRAEGNLIVRVSSFYLRFLRLYFSVPRFDAALSHGSAWTAYVARAKRKSSIVFSDNNIIPLYGKRIFKNSKYIITPKAYPVEQQLAQGARRENIYQFDGFKEDIYLADFKPDPDFLKGLPFDDFVTVRAESLQAMYVPKDAVSIVPELLKLFEKSGTNVLFLPRYDSDREYAKGFSNVYMPPGPLNGLDVCYYSQAVLTGAGTFAREAACMGTTAISFFPGKTLLAVDQKMVEDGWMFHSRKPDEIMDYVGSARKNPSDLSRSKSVNREVSGILNGILKEIEAKTG